MKRSHDKERSVQQCSSQTSKRVCGTAAQTGGAKFHQLNERRLFLLTFFPVEGAVHSGKCASPRSLRSVCLYSTWKSSRETRVKNGFDLKPSQKKKSLKTNSLKFFFPPPSRSEAMFSCQNVFPIKLPDHLHHSCLPLGRVVFIICGGCRSNAVVLIVQRSPHRTRLSKVAQCCTVKCYILYYDPLLHCFRIFPTELGHIFLSKCSLASPIHTSGYTHSNRAQNLKLNPWSLVITRDAGVDLQCFVTNRHLWISVSNKRISQKNSIYQYSTCSDSLDGERDGCELWSKCIFLLFLQ